MAPIDFAANGTAAPVIDAHVTGCSISTNGVVTVGVSGTVADATSDLIDAPGKQLQTLKVESPGGTQTINLPNNGAGEELPWKPYKWGSSFSATVSFTVTGPGDYPVNITTDINAGGMAASTTAYVTVSQSTAHIELNKLKSDTADSLRFYENTSTGKSGEIMVETSANSQMFTFPQNSANAGFKVEILSPAKLTNSVDTLHVRFHHFSATGNDTAEDHTFVESGATTKQFTYSRMNAVCQGFTKTDPGFFLPIILRLPAIEILETEDIAVEVMGREWKMKMKNFGDGKYCYLVDDQDKAVVFNPECYAHTHIQTKPIDGAWFEAEFKKKGSPIGKATLDKLDGLICRDAIPDKFFEDSLELNSFVHEGRNIGADKGVFHYGPKMDNGNASPVVPKSKNGSVKPEILWRYVTAKNAVVAFDSYRQLEFDIAYREWVVQSANIARFAYIGDAGSGGQKDPKFNKSLWKMEESEIQSGITALQELQKGVHAADAVEDFITNSGNSNEYAASTYAVACQTGAMIVCLRAVAKTVAGIRKNYFNDLVQESPLTFGRTKFIQERQAPGRPEFWIPGDWGNLRTMDPTRVRKDGTEGENVIYLGGSLKSDYDAFAADAEFWGHGMGKMKLKKMLDDLEVEWGFPLQVWPARRDLRLDGF